MNRKLEQGRATREALVATGRRLFTQRGYQRTSIEDLQTEAGVSRGGLYHHFAGKQALFEGVLEAVEADVARRLGQASSGFDDPAEALRAGCAAWLRLADDPAVRRITLIEAPSVVGWERWRAIDERHGLGLLKGALRAVAATGRLRPELVDVHAHLLLAALTEVALLLARTDDAAAVDAAGRAVDDLLDGLLRERPGDGPYAGAPAR